MLAGIVFALVVVVVLGIRGIAENTAMSKTPELRTRAEARMVEARKRRDSYSFYVVNAASGKGNLLPVLGGSTQGTHVMKSKNAAIPGVGTFLLSNTIGFGGGTTKPTLCGRVAARYVDVFAPGEVSCRECRRRWRLEVAAERGPSTEELLASSAKTADEMRARRRGPAG